MTIDDPKKDRIVVVTNAAAARALAEAAARHQAAEPERPKEIGGRKGPEPTRYGDWEKGGIVSDF